MVKFYVKRLINTHELFEAMPRKSREEWKVWGNVFDNFTIRTLFELSSKGHFTNLQSPVSVGKESNVFTAKTSDGRIIIAKIYRLESCDFNRMYDYIRFDPRFMNLKRQRRKVIFSWVQREFRNLMKARELNVRVPMPIVFKNNVMLEEFIGDEKPAPKLKDLYPKNKKEFFEKVIKNMKALYKGKFVHADLSEFNILNYNDNPVFIDFSTCPPLNNSMAQEYFTRDIKNIARFFNKIGFKTSEEEIKKKVTGK